MTGAKPQIIKKGYICDAKRKRAKKALGYGQRVVF